MCRIYCYWRTRWRHGAMIGRVTSAALPWQDLVRSVGASAIEPSQVVPCICLFSGWMLSTVSLSLCGCVCHAIGQQQRPFI